jgi:protein SCO1/2
MGQFALTDQAGEARSQDDFKGQVWAASFIFTRCPTACPLMMKAMRGVQTKASERGTDLRLVSFSVDPDNDTPPVLRAYAEKYEADLSRWTLLTGSYDEVKRTSVEGFKLALEGTADPSKADFGILHSSYLVLVDRDLQIRGYYSTQEPGRLDQLIEDAKRLSSGG